MSPDIAAAHPEQARPLHVGVLMAVYAGDDPALLDRALQSIALQRLAPAVGVRIYLGIDGAIDEKLEAVIRRHRGLVHTLVRMPQNVGLAKVLNALIDARGDESFYFRMDADDYSLPDRFQSQLDRMAADPALDVLGTDILEVDLETGERRTVQFLERPLDLRRFICRRVPVAHPTVCLRARVFERVPHYPEWRGNEDVAMWFACARQGMVFDNVHRPLLEFSISSRFWKRRSLEKARLEFTAYVRGIHALWGWHWRLVFPAARFLLRLAPTDLSKIIYRWRARGSA